MSPSTQTTSELRQRMIEDMRMRKFSPKTQSSYVLAVRRFAGHLGRALSVHSLERQSAVDSWHGFRAIAAHILADGHLGLGAPAPANRH